MKIKSPYVSRERILAYGGYGVGKSYAALTIANAIDEGTMYIVDNDNAYGRMLETEFSHLENVAHYPVSRRNDFDGVTKAIAKVIDIMGPHDWLVVDMLDPTWDGVQEWFIDQVYSVDIDEYMMEIKRARAVGRSITDGVDRAYPEIDWVPVKKVYAKRIIEPLTNVPGHLYCAAASKAVDGKTDGSAVRQAYGFIGFKPAGNKDIPHVFNTVLHMDRGKDEFTISTVKDRGRERLEDEVVKDFAADYLMGVAGWKKV